LQNVNVPLAAGWSMHIHRVAGACSLRSTIMREFAFTGSQTAEYPSKTSISFVASIVGQAVHDLSVNCSAWAKALTGHSTNAINKHANDRAVPPLLNRAAAKLTVPISSPNEFSMTATSELMKYPGRCGHS
jgi:hypothetical protein